jgi:hypothetical protein
MQMSVKDHFSSNEKENKTAKNNHAPARNKHNKDDSQSDKKSGTVVRGKDYHCFIIPFVY